ncbi:MAG: hypothetical protein ACRDLB_07395 [Actinomycetota bacterium]
MIRSKRMHLVSAAVGMAFVAGACGGGDGGSGADPNSYANDICTAVGDWVSAIQEGAASITESNDPASGVQALQSFLDNAVSDTENLISEVEAAGAPDVDGGEEFADDLRAAFEEARTVLEQARDDVADLPTDDPTAFGEAASELGASVQEALGAVGDELQEPEAEELGAAFEEEEACTSVGSGA